jgi:tripartite-type tricarboxylate transporter receptor subunit TctC
MLSGFALGSSAARMSSGRAQMPVSRFRIWFLAVALLGGSTADAQPWPGKAIRVLTGPTASASDIVTREIANGVSAALGQAVVVDNRAGIVAVESAAKSSPDGYTLLIFGSVVWMEPLLRKSAAWDPVRDLSSISLLARSPNVLVVPSSLPVNSVADLIALAKSKPGELSYASAGSGTTAQLAAELFKSMAGGLDIVHVPYKGLTPALIDLMAGRVQMSFAVAASVVGQVKAGKLKALAVTSAQPSTLAPGMPTMAAAGLPGYESELIIGAFAPARTPPSIIARLNREMLNVLMQTSTREKLLAAGTEAVGSTPAQLLAAGQADMARWGKVIRDAGIQSD